jgi:hypothetical protein
VFAFRGGQLSCRYQRSGIAAGHRALGIALTEQELAAMDLFDEVARAPEHRLAFFLERGDMLVINNYTVMHARTKFAEYAQPERRRHLVRLWLDAEGFRDVPREVNLFAVNGVPRQKAVAALRLQELTATIPVPRAACPRAARRIRAGRSGP